MSAVAARSTDEFFALLNALARQLRGCVYVLSGVLLAAGSARAEAPTLSPEFWNYMVEFGDDKGEVFDPADYATATKLPVKARDDADHVADQHSAEQQRAADNRAAPKGEEQSQ